MTSSPLRAEGEVEDALRRAATGHWVGDDLPSQSFLDRHLLAEEVAALRAERAGIWDEGYRACYDALTEVLTGKDTVRRTNPYGSGS